MERLLIVGGHVVDPVNSVDEKLDVLIADGKIEKIGKNIKADSGVQTIEAGGHYVVPGLIDMHVHFREPGGEHRETIETGCHAAVAGGFTAVAAMPNTNPVTDNHATVGYQIREAIRAGYARLHPVGAITLASGGENLAEMGEMLSAGAVAFSDDGHCLVDSEIMRKSMLYSTIFDVLIINHSEDPSLAVGSMNSGLIASRLGLGGIPPESEEIMVYRDCALARLTGARIHIAHVSTARSVEVIRRFKSEGVRVTAEVTPHHLTLTEDEVEGYNTNAKVSPPLRTTEDTLALIDGLRDGTIDCIASDHAPHHYDEKITAFADAPNGVIGLETTLPVCYSKLVQENKLALSELINKLSARPAELLGLDGGSLAEGKPADISILDLDSQWTIDASKFKSKSRNTPFNGWDVSGRAVKTLVGGKLVWDLHK